jgi:hypothetical protein
LRTKGNASQVIDGQLEIDYSKSNLYPTAFPFDRCNKGNPGALAYVSIHGYNNTVTTAADLWPLNIVRTLPTTGFTVGISSANANDTIAGTGARTVEIDILDTSYIPHTITLELNGQTKVVDTNYVGTALRINDMRIASYGTGLANAGIIYGYDSSDTVTGGVPQTSTLIFSYITAGANTCRCGFYTVPAGCKLQTQQIRGGFNDSVTTTRAAVVSFKYIFNTASGRVATYFPLVGQINNGAPSFRIDPDFKVVLDEKTDIVLQATASASSVVTAYLDAILFYK